MIIAFTGHRPNKLGGYHTPNPIYNLVCWNLEEALIDLKPEKAISGMALGVDQWAAHICVHMGIPFIAAVPFSGQELAWPERSQRDYQHLLKKAAEIVIVSKGDYSASKMQIRNQFMVDKCDIVIAVWDGTSGGTGNCVQYAQSKGKEIFRIVP